MIRYCLLADFILVLDTFVVAAFGLPPLFRTLVPGEGFTVMVTVTVLRLLPLELTKRPVIAFRATDLADLTASCTLMLLRPGGVLIVRYFMASIVTCQSRRGQVNGTS